MSAGQRDLDGFVSLYFSTLSLSSKQENLIPIYQQYLATECPDTVQARFTFSNITFVFYIDLVTLYSQTLNEWTCE